MFLLVYLCAWGGGMQGLPLLMMAIGDAHKAFLASNHDETYLVLHHPGNQDQHELATDASLPYKADLMDKLLYLSFAGKDSAPDHVLILPHLQDQITHGAKINTFSIGMSPTPLAASRPFFAQIVSVYLLPQPPPQTHPTLLSLRTTTLLI